jgi:hypothetical protein
MPTLNDDQYAATNTTDLQLEDEYLIWLKAQPGVTSDVLVTAEQEFLRGQGVPSRPLSDMWFTYLRVQGFFGTNSDMKAAFWLSKVP